MAGANDLSELLKGTAAAVAPRLLGCHLVYDNGEQRLVGKIVETEAYDQTDAASHSYRDQTPRSDVMFGPPGYLYVYFTYGMHYCCNVVVGEAGYGAAVLIRALEPLEGQHIMRPRRRGLADGQLTNGPAKLCQAFGIDRIYNGHDLNQAPLQLMMQPPLAQNAIVQTTRIGIAKAKDMPWRFYIRGNQYVSKP